MENENMNYDEAMETEEVAVVEDKPGINTGLAMLIGGGLALAGAAGIRKLKKVIANHKAKKAAEAVVIEAPAEEE